jgi:hypothetical protein
MNMITWMTTRFPMKWTKKMRRFVAKRPKAGDLRVVRKFMLWPRQFGRDWRWLEYANIIEKREPGWHESPYWIEIDFEDNRTRYLEKIEGAEIE